MMARQRVFIITAAIVFFSICSPAQVITETAFPKLPYENNSSSIISNGKEFYIAGRSGYEYDNSFMDKWGSVYQPYFILHPNTKSKKIVLLTTLEQGSYYGFGGNKNIISLSSVVTGADSFFVAWSNIAEEYTDVGPFVYMSLPKMYISQLDQDSLRTIQTIPNGLNPTIAADENNTVHYIWENIQRRDTVYISRFSKYSSTVTYQSRNSDGATTGFVEIGKGFFPLLVLKNGKQHVLFLKADSSNQNTVQISYVRGENGVFGVPVSLHTLFVQNYFRNPILVDRTFLNTQWYVDSLDHIHAVWKSSPYDSRKTFIAHYSSGGGVQIDSIELPNATVRFAKNGIVRVYSIVNNGGSDSLVRYESKQGSNVTKLKTYVLPKNVSLNHIITDTKEGEHLLLQNTNEERGIFIVKFSNTDSAKTFLISKGYTIGATSFVDSANRVWLTGAVGSQHYLLKFWLDSVGHFQDFTFPLSVGDEWQYYVSNGIGDPGTTAIVKAKKDTVMKNGKRYIYLTSNKFLRKEGLKIFCYVPEDSTEYLQYDFSRNTGDTIAIAKRFGSPLPVILSKIYINESRKTYRFTGTVSNSTFDMYATEVTDSIGITGAECGICETFYKFRGAIINGKKYGSVLSVDETNSTPVSFSLFQNYPNPFNPTTTINYQLPTNSLITLKVYDVLGREVAVLVNDVKNAGTYSVQWNALQFSSGIYFAKMRAGSFSSSKKLLLMK